MKSQNSIGSFSMFVSQTMILSSLLRIIFYRETQRSLRHIEVVRTMEVKEVGIYMSIIVLEQKHQILYNGAAQNIRLTMTGNLLMVVLLIRSRPILK